MLHVLTNPLKGIISSMYHERQRKIEKYEKVTDEQTDCHGHNLSYPSWRRLVFSSDRLFHTFVYGCRYQHGKRKRKEVVQLVLPERLIRRLVYESNKPREENTVPASFTAGTDWCTCLSDRNAHNSDCPALA